MTVFTKTAVLQTLEEIVAETGPDFVYQWRNDGGIGSSCTYADSEGEPSCIVGRVIAKLDPELFKAVAEAEERKGSSWSVSAFPDDEFGTKVCGVPTLPASDEVRRILRAAQSTQDGGRPYGEALENAKTTAEGY